MNHYIAIDIGGTKILATLFADGKIFKILQEKTIPTQAKKGREQVLKNMCSAIDALCGDHCDKKVNAIGISWAGFVDANNATIKKSPNIPHFDDFNLAEFFEKKYSIPTIVENDARLFAYAEYFVQNPKPEVLLGIIFGTGVGSGIIVNGKILHGAENYAGEIGHQAATLLENDNSHFPETEDLFSGPNIGKFLQTKTQTVTKNFATNPEERDKVAQKLQPRIHALAHWIINISLCLNPSTVIFGGGAGQHFWPWFFPEIKTEIANILKEKKYPLTIHIQKAHLNNAGVVGAAALAKKFFEEKKS